MSVAVAVIEQCWLSSRINLGYPGFQRAASLEAALSFRNNSDSLPYPHCFRIGDAPASIWPVWKLIRLLM